MQKELPKWVTSSDGYGVKRRIKSLIPALIAVGIYFGVDLDESTIMLVVNSGLVVWAVIFHLWGWFKALYINR